MTFIVPASLGLSLTNEAAVAPAVEVFSQTIENFTASSISAELPQTDFSATPSQGETGDSVTFALLEIDPQGEFVKVKADTDSLEDIDLSKLPNGRYVLLQKTKGEEAQFLGDRQTGKLYYVEVLDGEVRYLEVDNQLEEQLQQYNQQPNNQQPNDQQPKATPSENGERLAVGAAAAGAMLSGRFGRRMRTAELSNAQGRSLGKPARRLRKARIV